MYRLQRLLDLFQQDAQDHWFQRTGATPRLGCERYTFRRKAFAQPNDRNPECSDVRLQHFDRGTALYSGHVQIHQYDIGPVFQSGRNGMATVFSRSHFVPASLQASDQERSEVRSVID